ncbi:MAG TPA: hypothetical protein ENH59_10990 [Bacteroidetes bacterium]|nr:hypothetical protein [Bacteroidota bacterium]
MKKLIVLIVFVALMSALNMNGINVSPSYAQSPGDTVHLIISPELSELVAMWITKYSTANPDAVIKGSDIENGRGINDLKKEGTLGIVTEEYLRSLDRASLWTMVVARDVIVPVISSKNPFSEKINTRGISPGQFSGIYTEPGMLTWGKVLDTGDNTTVNCYCLDDEALKFSLSQFLQAENLRSNIKKVNDNSELIEHIKNDKYAIGFCRLSGIIDFEKHSIAEGVQIVPVDVNGNGILEHNENIYSCLNDFTRGVWIGKYPGSLCRNIHIVSSEAPVDVKEKGFISWVLSGGQAYISEAGFSELIPGERQPKIQALNAADVVLVKSKEQPVKAAVILFIAGTVLLAGFLIFLVVKLVKASAKEPEAAFSNESSVFNEDSVTAPAGLFYDKTHTWVFMEKDGKVKVGIDDFLQHVTGKVTKIKMKEPGLKIKKGETVISLVQNGKQLDIYSPVSGRITETNHELAVNASVLNNSPYSEGWIYTIEPDNWLKETSKYFMVDNYRQWLKTEFTRLKDFIAGAVRLNDLNYYQVVLQDGGEIKDRVMENFGPNVWEEFQRGFIDPAVLE